MTFRELLFLLELKGTLIVDLADGEDDGRYVVSMDTHDSDLTFTLIETTVDDDEFCFWWVPEGAEEAWNAGEITLVK